MAIKRGVLVLVLVMSSSAAGASSFTASTTVSVPAMAGVRIDTPSESAGEINVSLFSGSGHTVVQRHVTTADGLTTTVSAQGVVTKAGWGTTVSRVERGIRYEVWSF